MTVKYSQTLIEDAYKRVSLLKYCRLKSYTRCMYKTYTVTVLYGQTLIECLRKRV